MKAHQHRKRHTLTCSGIDCDTKVEALTQHNVAFCSNSCKQRERHARNKGVYARCKTCGASFKKPNSRSVNCEECR